MVRNHLPIFKTKLVVFSKRIIYGAEFVKKSPMVPAGNALGVLSSPPQADHIPPLKAAG